MSDPISVEERARRYVALMPAAISGGGGHNATLHVAAVLLQGFDLPMHSARSILAEYNMRCDPPWKESELEHKLKSANGLGGLKTLDGIQGRGCLLKSNYQPTAPGSSPRPYAAPEPPKKAPEFDASRLRELAGQWREVVDLRWLANRSVVDPCDVTSDAFLKLLYKQGEKLLAFTNQQSQGQALWPDEPLPKGSEDGVWFLAQPLDGLYHPNPRTEKPSRRSAESVLAFRYLLLESDKADMRDWLGLLVQLPLRIEAIYTSGGRSIHTLVRIDAPTKTAWDDEKNALGPTLNLLGMAGADLKALSAVRLTRLPSAMRGSRLQKLLYLRPDAPIRALKDTPPVRDVEEFWLQCAAPGISDADETHGAAVIQGLSYYANVSERCREALATLKQQLAASQ